MKKILIAVAALLFASPVYAELRLEATAGVAKHGLAPEGSWWYDGFETNNQLQTSAFAVGLLWTPWEWRGYRLGMRGGYSDLGTVKANNHFPIYEDGSIHDARVNSNCDRTTLSGCTGKYRGAGTTKGFYFGPAGERDFGPVTLGAEVGLFMYRSKWVAINARGVDSAGEFMPAGWDRTQWDQVRNDHGTWYAGVNARWNGWFVSYRHYANVRAADTSKGFEYVGLTSGPVWSLMVGASLGF